MVQADVAFGTRRLLVAPKFVSVLTFRVFFITMAAVLRIALTGLIPVRNVPSIPIFQTVLRSSHILRRDNNEDKVVMAENGSTIVCWHPAPT